MVALTDARKLGVLFFIVTLCWFGTLGYRELVRPDEGRYAEIPREMVVSGDWVTPRINRIKYFEKPPLQYWATAVAFSLFGEHEWTARLWPALSGFALLGLVFFAGRRWFSASAAVFAALVLASSMLFIAMGHFATLDMGVSLFLNLTVFALLFAQSDGASHRARFAWMMVAWGAAALAVLSKGLIGIVLPAAAVSVLMLWQRKLDWLRRAHWLPGMALFLAITLPWFIAVSRANPEFLEFFFVREHVQRFLSTTHSRPGPLWYFIPVLAVGSLPWLGFAIPAFARAFSGADVVRRGLIVWIAIVFVFFSVSGSKLPAYILPLYPALALLIGDGIAKACSPRTWRAGIIGFLLSALLLAVLGFYAPAFARPDQPPELYRSYGGWLIGAAALLMLACGVAQWGFTRARLPAAIATLALGGMAAWQAALLGYEVLRPATSGYDMAVALRAIVKSDVPFYSVELYDQTLPFYLQRPVTLVGHRDELAFGLQQEPAKWIPDIPTFIKKWNEGSDAFAILRPGLYRKLLETGLPMTVVSASLQYLVVRKPQGAATRGDGFKR